MEKFKICVIGAGGTGSYFLKEFSRYLYENKKAQQQIRRMVIVDGDRVEEKNLVRQSFMKEDVAAPKSAVMASALNDAFALDWKGYARYLLREEELEQDFIGAIDGSEIPLIIGCVDNHACRLVCEEFFEKSSTCIYFDAANEFTSGEVVFALKRKGELISPLRSMLFPDVLKGDLRNVEEMSCAELSEAAPQHIAVNMNAGMILLSAVTSLLEDGVCITGITVFDARYMTSMHFPSNEDILKGKKHEKTNENQESS